MTKTKEELFSKIESLERQLLKTKKIKDQLHQQKSKYESAISALSEGIVIQDLDGSIIECNQAAEEILGLSREQMMGKKSVDPDWRSIHEDGSEFPGEKHPTMVTLKTKKSQSNVIMGVHKPNGELTWISINSRPIFNNKNEITSVVASFKNITRIKQKEDNLKDQISEHLQERDKHLNLLKTVIEEAPIVMFWFDSNGIFTFSEGKGLGKLGLKPGEVVGLSVFDVYKEFPEITEQCKSALKGNLVRGTIKVGEIYFDIFYQPIFDKENNIASVVGVATDITERKIAEEKIKVSETKFRAIFDTIAEAIFLIDIDGKIAEINKAVTNIYGYSKGELIGTTPKKFIHPDYHSKFDEFLEILKSKHTFKDETIDVRKDGTTFNTFVIGTKIKFGNKEYFLASVRNITMQKKQEQELIRNTQLNTALIRLYENTNLEEKKFIQLTLDEAVKLSDSKIGYLHFFNEGSEEIQLVTWSTETFKQCNAVYDNHYPLKKAGVWADAVRYKKPVIINDYKNLKQKLGLPDGHFPLANHLGIPIFEGKKVVGIIGVGNKEEDYTEEDVSQLEIYSRSLWEIIKGIRTDNELKNSEEKFRLLFENMNEGFAVHEIICDENEKPIDYKYLEMNPAFEKLTGIIKEKAIGKTAKELLPGIEDDPADWIGKYGEVGLTGTDLRFVNYVEPLKKYYQVHAFSLKKNQFALTISDITDIKKHEKQLEEAKEFNELMVENSPYGIQAYKENGECVLANSTASNTVGASKEYLLSQNFHNIESWKTSGLYQVALDTLRTGKSAFKTILLNTPFKKNIWVDSYLSKFMIKGESHLLVLIKDVTERIIVKQQRDRYFNTTLSMLCTANMDGYFITLNPSWEKILGYSIDELKSKPFLDFVHPDDKKDTLLEMKKLNEGATVVNFTNRYRCKNGEYRWINWVSTPYDNIIYASANDITEIKNHEAILKETLIELERSNKELEQFAYVSSHDLQEPLRKIKNYAELLEARYREELDDQARKYISVITKGASHMQKLIDDLLSFSRVSTRKKEFKPVNFNKVIEHTVDTLELIIFQSKAKLKIEDLPTINADEIQMGQLFQNLISNAIKFCNNQPPEIEIKSIEQKTQWKFSIKDNGIGFNMDYSERIFTVFQRLHAKNEYEGTGIGLALCKKIVERHKGRIWAKSREGGGATFYFTIAKDL